MPRSQLHDLFKERLAETKQKLEWHGKHHVELKLDINYITDLIEESEQLDAIAFDLDVFKILLLCDSTRVRTRKIRVHGRDLYTEKHDFTPPPPAFIYTLTTYGKNFEIVCGLNKARHTAALWNLHYIGKLRLVNMPTQDSNRSPWTSCVG